MGTTGEKKHNVSSKLVNSEGYNNDNNNNNNGI